MSRGAVRAQMRRSMLSRCPVSPFAEVAQTVEADLGAPPSVLFASFEEAPIASASLAQARQLPGPAGGCFCGAVRVD